MSNLIVGEAEGPGLERLLFTYAVVATVVELSAVVGVGADTVPEKVGLASGA